MAIARLHGGPLDGQVLPMDSPDAERLVLPYAETQLIYRRRGDSEHTGTSDGPTETPFWYAESQDDLVTDDD